MAAEIGEGGQGSREHSNCAKKSAGQAGKGRESVWLSAVG